MERSSLRVLRELRWGHVVVELALLVVGILVALAVDGWIDGRREARVERQYLELLVRDLERDLEMLADVVAFENAQIARVSGPTARCAWAWGGIVRPWPRRSDNSSRRTLRLSTSTYTDLLSTGNLRLIRNRLRDRIVNLYEYNERAQLIRDRNNQEFVDRMYMTYFVDRGLVAPRPARACRGSQRRTSASRNVRCRSARATTGSGPATGRSGMGRAGRSCLVPRPGEPGRARAVAADGREIDAVRQAVVHELEIRRWP